MLGFLSVTFPLFGQAPAKTTPAPTTPAEKPATPASEGEKTPQAVSETYKLSPNDLIRIKVYQEDDLNADLRLGKDGTVNYWLLETVELGGKTLKEAADHIKELLKKDYLVNPQVSVSIIEYARRTYTIYGEVKNPGDYPIPSEEVVTLQQAIAKAGGFTSIAAKGNVKLTRGGVVTKINAKDTTQKVTLQPGDIIVVEESFL